MNNEQLKALCDHLEPKIEAATPKPLDITRYSHGGGRMFSGRDLIADFYDEGNREFYVAANPEAVRTLVQGVRGLIEENAAREAEAGALVQLASKVWESRWVSEDAQYQEAVGIAAEVQSGNFNSGKILVNALRQYNAALKCRHSDLAELLRTEQMRNEMKDRELSSLRSTVERLRNVIVENCKCGVIYCDEPRGTTCLSQMRDAIDGKGNLGDKWRAELSSGARLCKNCRLIREALAKERV